MATQEINEKSKNDQPIPKKTSQIS